MVFPAPSQIAPFSLLRGRIRTASLGDVDRVHTCSQYVALPYGRYRWWAFGLGNFFDDLYTPLRLFTTLWPRKDRFIKCRAHGPIFIEYDPPSYSYTLN
jgi:hypothetical protein